MSLTRHVEFVRIPQRQAAPSGGRSDPVPSPRESGERARERGPLTHCSVCLKIAASAPLPRAFGPRPLPAFAGRGEDLAHGQPYEFDGIHQRAAGRGARAFSATPCRLEDEVDEQLLLATEKLFREA